MKTHLVNEVFGVGRLDPRPEERQPEGLLRVGEAGEPVRPLHHDRAEEPYEALLEVFAVGAVATEGETELGRVE